MNGQARRWAASIAIGSLVLFSVACERDSRAEEGVERVSSAATLGPDFVDELVFSGLDTPTTMEIAPDGRIFVCQQNGYVRIVKNGSVLEPPFLSVPVDSSGERGLLGFAFDPDFTSNQLVYVYYTTTSPTVHNRVSRFRASGDQVAANSETVLLDLPALGATNHNGGTLHFGPDGKLYIAVGENANAPNAQTLSNPLGKLLRINSDGTIPTDNPFLASTTGSARAIWALGLRNPFTFAFQPGTQRLFINDVGQDAWEEIDDGVAGSNYGWPTTEGVTSDAKFRSPLFVYGHGSDASAGCAITGGTFYNPGTAQYPGSYVGKYFFADYCSGWIRLFDPATGTATGFATGVAAPLDLDVAVDGSLYYLARGGNTGSIGRIRYAPSQAPKITAQPVNTTAAVGSTVKLGVSASGSQPLSYQWQRNGANVGSNAASYQFVASAADNGATFRVVVSNSFGTVTSNTVTFNITANQPPSPLISAPVSGTKFVAGQTIAYAGSGSDPEDGALRASSLSWLAELHHDTHVHPFIPETSGISSGTFVVPRTGHTETNIFYRLELTATDSQGVSTTTYRDIVPILSSFTLQTSPPGLQVTVDGTPYPAGSTITGIVGVTRTLGIISPQTIGGTTYTFTGWSDGGANIHNIDTPASATTYTASYAAQSGSGNLASQGTIIAKVPDPIGGGNHNLEIVRDGVKPAVASADSSLQFDTYHGATAASDDWIGYSFASAHTFNKVVFQEGRSFGDGGWFDSLRVQVRQAGAWVDASSLSITPSYPGNNGVSFETFTLEFAPLAGDAIRLYGAPGGVSDFISVAELEVYEGTTAPPPSAGNLAGQATIIARVTAPTGGGSRDLEVIRDSVKPASGSANSAVQYDTYHGVGAVAEDWIGYSFASAHTFNKLVFQEGRHFVDGGWFDSLKVQVRQSGVWVDAAGLSIAPSYGGNNGVGFETFALTFTPTTGDAIRIDGAPGGASDFISVAELEVYESTSTTPPPSSSVNVTSQATIIALVTAPTGGGNYSLETIRDGVKPAVNSTSSSQQYDTYHGPNAATDDWIGYAFSSTRTFNKLIYQEGRNFSDGGWFDTLRVQVRQSGAWVNVAGLTIAPSYPGNNGVSYETFTLSFGAIAGDAIRIDGTPGGASHFISVAELEAYAVQ